eukprot:GFKZ01004061.1.p1 GENE.GFKZ01004061.1~~GFKZ01004061.1.p1  ORF type:complete len:203 (+),score=2.64 GFKZ01004061.1:730-1338(+)
MLYPYNLTPPSCKTDRANSDILSNSSMKHTLRSHRTSTPDSRTFSSMSGSRVTYAVSPTAEDPRPDVYTPRGDSRCALCINCDLEVTGSPTSKTLMADRKRAEPSNGSPHSPDQLLFCWRPRIAGVVHLPSHWTFQKCLEEDLCKGGHIRQNGKTASQRIFSMPSALLYMFPYSLPLLPLGSRLSYSVLFSKFVALAVRDGP